MRNGHHHHFCCLPSVRGGQMPLGKWLGFLLLLLLWVTALAHVGVVDAVVVDRPVFEAADELEQR
jgi:hypothetical protein